MGKQTLRTSRASTRQTSAAAHFTALNRIAADAASAVTGRPLGQATFKCGVCSKEFKYYSGLTRHRKTHTKLDMKLCTHCGKKFVENSHLTYHIRSEHTNQKPYSCSVCSKAFIDKPHLRRHEFIHQSQKPFKCDKCTNTFAQRVQLRQHRISHGH